MRFLAGRFLDARELLEPAITEAPARAHNDIALTYAAEGRFAEALEHLNLALAADSSDGGVWLNAGLIRYVTNDDTGASAAIRAGVDRVGGLEAAGELLGLPREPTSARSGDTELSEQEALALLRAAVTEVPSADEEPRDSGPVEHVPEAPTPPEPARLRTAAVRGAERFALSERLYWKP